MVAPCLFLLPLLMLLFPTVAWSAVGFFAGHENGTTDEWCGGQQEAIGACYYPNQIFPTQGSARTGNWGLFSRHTNPASGVYDGKVIHNRFFGIQSIRPGQNYYYTAWYRIVQGYNDQFWRNIMQWKGFPSGSCNGANGVSFRIEFHRFGSAAATREVSVHHQACHEGATPCVDVAGDLAGTPPGVYRKAAPTVPVPTNTWFNIQVFYKPATTNGQLTVWQNGVQILNIAHANLNTLTTKCATVNRLQWGIGNYVSPSAVGVQELHMDDAQVADQFIPVGGVPPPPPPPPDPPPPTPVQTQTTARIESATGTEAAPTATYGTSHTAEAEEAYRIRCAIDTTVGTQVEAGYSTFWSTSENGNYASPATTCGTTNPVCFDATVFPSLLDQEPTTERLFTASTFVAGKVRLDNGQLLMGPFTNGQGTELVTGIKFDPSAVGSTFYFKCTRDDVLLDAYPVVPSITVTTPAPPPPATPVPGNIRDGVSITGGLTIK